MPRCIICALVFAAVMVGQTFELKDGNCTSLLSVSEVKMLRYSQYFGEDIPEFQASVKNISGGDLDVGAITATVHRKDGSKAEFSFTVCPKATCRMDRDATMAVSRTDFSPVLLFKRDDYDFGGVEFALSDSQECPEFRRLVAEGLARRETARAKEVEEQAKKDAALDEWNRVQNLRLEKERAAEAARATERRRQLEKERAVEAVRAAEERRKLRANCTIIYQNTIDKKVKDLTVREEQQVRACQVLGLYPPR
jgi:hypothetical protein